MAEQGWVKLWRKALDNTDLRDFDAIGLWAKLLMMARREDGSEKINGVRADVKRGQVAVSLAKLAEEGGMTRGRLRAITTKLINEGMIEVNHVTAKQWSVVTICNYDEYQASPRAEKPSNNQAATKQQPTEQPTVQEGETRETQESQPTVVVDSDSGARASRDDDDADKAVMTLAVQNGSNPATVRKLIASWYAKLPAEDVRGVIWSAIDKWERGDSHDPLGLMQRHVGLRSDDIRRVKETGAAPSRPVQFRREDQAQAKALERVQRQQLKETAKAILKKRGLNPNADDYDLKLSDEMRRLRNVGVGSSALQ